MTETIRLLAYPSIGPPENHLIIKTPQFLKFEHIRKKISSIYHTGIHNNTVIVKDSLEIPVDSDIKTVEELGLKDLDEIIISFNTPAIPTFSSKCKKILDVDISDDVIDGCIEHANRNPCVEVAGVLIGKEYKKNIHIEKFVPVSTGDSVSVNLTPLTISKISQEYRNTRNYIVGWYHSHTRSAEPSAIDVRLQTAYQMMYPYCIAMVIDNMKQSVMFFQSTVAQNSSLNNSASKVISMESETVTLTTKLAKKQSVKILSINIKDIQTGTDAILNAEIKNTGTIPVNNLILLSSWINPETKEVLRTSTSSFSLDINEIKSIFIRQNIPLLWPEGTVTVRSGIKLNDSEDWIERGWLNTFVIKQPPIYDVKLKVTKPEQEILPNQSAVYVVFVKNNGNQKDTIELKYSVEDPDSLWSVIVYDEKTQKESPFQITLSPGEVKRIMIQVKGPQIGTAGTEFPVAFSATSLGRITPN